jgi:hypothetical protein
VKNGRPLSGDEPRAGLFVSALRRRFRLQTCAPVAELTMATITRAGSVLKIIGTDVVNANNSLNAAGLRAALFADACPVGNLAGKVDFVVCFVDQGPQPGEFGATDHAVQPRPLRGIIYLADSLATLSPSRLGTILGDSVAHEFGHYWLVPAATKIRVGNELVAVPRTQQLADTLNQGLPLPPFPIIGRQDKHWSPFIDCDSTPMEAPNLGAPVKTPGVGPLGHLGRYDQVTGQDKAGPAFTLPGSGEVKPRFRFCTLERWLMGSYTPPAITSVGILWPTFLTLVPRWSFPFDFESGLYVRLTSGECWYLGFHRGPHEICAHEISRPGPAQVISLGLDPFDPYVRVGARVIQRGSTIDLQMRCWAPRSLFRPQAPAGGGPRSPSFSFWRRPVNPSCDEMMSDVGQGAPGTSDMWTGWKTLASTGGQVDRMGLSSRTLSGGLMHTMLSATLCLNRAGVTTPMATRDLQQDFPTAGPVLLPSGHLVTPYLLADGTNPIFEETATSHKAPKLVTAAPAGDFGFGGLVSLDRCIQVNWAGGLATGKKMVGQADNVALNRFIPPWNDADRAIRQGAPADGAYKVLFCLAARTDTISSEMMANLNTVKQGWELYSPLLLDRASDGNVF